ncbi:HAMP domain-containing histidine kinase [bacterium]|nr:HAMP domain-containing histidine kinase [bacterium]
MNLKKILKNIFWVLTASKTLNNLPDSIVFIDSEGYVVKFNKKAQECFNLDLNSEYPLKLDDFILDGLEMVKTSLKMAKPVLATAHTPEKEFYVELNASKQGKGLCVVIRDVTKLINQEVTEEKIARFNGEKNAMLVKLEGDIKAPITSILGFSQGLIDGIGGELTEKQNKYVKIINSSSNDLYNFMDKFLEFSYAESSLYEPDYKTFDIIEVLKNIVKKHASICEEKKLECTFDYETIEKRAVYTDFKAFQKAFDNIIEVALSMTEKGGISLRLDYPDHQDSILYGFAQNKNYIHISIDDTSSGIDPAEMKYLCDPYYQMENNKKNLQRAFKLGSASILIRRSGGYIDINSEVNQGISYDIILPIEKEQNEQRNS